MYGKFYQSILSLPGAICALILIGSCQNAQVMVSDTPTSIESTQLIVSNQTATPEIESSDYIDAEELLQSMPTVAPQPTQVVSAETINFPTPLPASDVDWRPPLYEIPWMPGLHDHFFFQRPIAVNEVNWPQPDYRYGGTFFAPDIVHTGIDIVAPRGTPVLAAASGRVVWAGTGLYFGAYNPDDPYGIAVVIEHGFGYKNETLYTVYAHMDSVVVMLGEDVDTGQTLGFVGDTGYTTGPHLHFEVRTGKNDFYKTRNPELWIAPPQGWGILTGRIMNANNGLIEKLEIHVYSETESKDRNVITYTMKGINGDDYYKENFVLSDLPAGTYTVSFQMNDVNYKHTITIHAGLVTFFSFHPSTGFDDSLPAEASEKEWLILSNN